MSKQQIPVVDLRDFYGPEREAFIKTLGEGLERFGFVAVIGHGVPWTLIERAYADSWDAFQLPQDTKGRWERRDISRQRGYTPFGVEHAKDTSQPDLKEFWQIGRELPDDHPLRASGEVPANVFPDGDVDRFGETFRELFVKMEDFANRLLEAVGEYLDLPEGTFRDMVKDGNSVLRVIHYPDMPDAPPGAVRAAQHEDINLLTVLPRAGRPGLELMTRDGEWMAIEVPPEVMICDTGDMMTLVTGGVMPATTHRVVNPPGQDGGRLSMPFFLHPRPDFLLRDLKAGGEGVMARDFLQRRLEEIGVA